MGAAETVLLGGVLAVGLVVILTLVAGVLIVWAIEAIDEVREN